MAQPRYTVVMQWSDEDEKYVVSLPEWGTLCKTHGDTYEEAARNARDVLELLLDGTLGRAITPPAPKLFHYPGAAVIDLPDDDAVVDAPAADTPAVDESVVDDARQTA